MRGWLGEVLSVNHSEVRIAFDLAGTSRRGRVYLNESSPEYHSGQAVTVLVDPDDPRTLTIEEEENQGPLAWRLSVVSLPTGVLILIISGIRLGGASDQKIARSQPLENLSRPVPYVSEG